MRSDADRFRFIAQFQLSITWHDDSASLFWRGKPQPGEPGAYFPIENARTLDEAVDRAMDRWEKQHGMRFS